MNTYHLAIDLGATSGRTILATFDGHHISTEEIARFRYPMLPAAGHLFWNLPLIYEEIVKSLCKAAEISKSPEHGCILSESIPGAATSLISIKTAVLPGYPTAIAIPHTQCGRNILRHLRQRESLWCDWHPVHGFQHSLSASYSATQQCSRTRHRRQDHVYSRRAVLYAHRQRRHRIYRSIDISDMLNLATGDFDQDILESFERHAINSVRWCIREKKSVF